MKIYLIRVLISLLIIVVYFTIWKSVRGYVTSELVIPQIDYAIANCDDTIAFDRLKETSLAIHLLNREDNEYITYGYTSPAGFYLLFGLVLIVLLGGSRFYYYLLVGFHGLFWAISTATITAGLCYQSLLLHVTFAGIKYVTPFITFLILILLISPKPREKLNVPDKTRAEK